MGVTVFKTAMAVAATAALASVGAEAQCTGLTGAAQANCVAYGNLADSLGRLNWVKCKGGQNFPIDPCATSSNCLTANGVDYFDIGCSNGEWVSFGFKQETNAAIVDQTQFQQAVEGLASLPSFTTLSLTNQANLGLTTCVDACFSITCLFTLGCTDQCVENGRCDTVAPTTSPTTLAPSLSPTTSPSMSPTTAQPSKSPTTSPSRSPTLPPVDGPTDSPSVSPTMSPTTAAPTNSEAPTSSDAPSASPSASPTMAPSLSPCSQYWKDYMNNQTIGPPPPNCTLSTPSPTEAPTEATGNPTQSPTAAASNLHASAPLLCALLLATAAATHRTGADQ